MALSATALALRLIVLWPKPSGSNSSIGGANSTSESSRLSVALPRLPRPDRAPVGFTVSSSPPAIDNDPKTTPSCGEAV